MAEKHWFRTSRPGVGPAAYARQRGVALLTAMVFLLVLTIGAIAAMRSTTLDYRITSNVAQRGHSFEVSESARRQVGSVIDAHVDARGWQGVTLPADLVVVNAATSDGLLYVGDNAPLGDISDTAADFTYRSSTPSARVFVSRLDQQLATGTGAATSEGYSGLGFGSAAGGGLLFFDVRSVGAGAGESRAVTGADFRHVIR